MFDRFAEAVVRELRGSWAPPVAPVLAEDGVFRSFADLHMG